jgi:hypothetical protein
VRGEIADQVGAATRDRLPPIAGVFLEIGLAERVDLLADEAGDGHFFLHRNAATIARPAIQMLPSRSNYPGDVSS